MRLDDDDFALFGLPRQHAVDIADLDARWRRLQAEVHPDRFAAEGAAARRVAMQWAVRVNEAYARLKDPMRRGAYLCELAGVPIDAERNTAMPPAFLHQQMAWRESLDDAGGAADIEALLDEVDAAERRLLHELQSQLDARQDAPGAAATVRALMFVSRFRQDVERRLDALDDSR